MQKVVKRMSKYFNDAGDSVPEMVAELKEKYEKAEAFDRIAKMYNFFKAEHRSTIPTDDETLDFAIDISKIIDEYESGGSNEL